MTASIIQIEPGKVQVGGSVADYHADKDWLGSGAIRDYRKSVKLFAAKYIHKTRKDDAQEPFMVLGSMVDAFLTEGKEALENRFRVRPDARTKEGKEFIRAHAHLVENGTLTLVPEGLHAKAIKMADAVMANPLARRLIEAPGTSQVPMRWIDPVSGVRCKGLCDFLRVYDGLPYDLSLKTGNFYSEDSINRAVASRGYLLQSAQYCEGASFEAGVTVYPKYICVSSDGEHETWVMGVGGPSYDTARKQLRDTRLEIAERMQRNDWEPLSHRTEGQINLPKWELLETDDLEEI